MAAGHSALCGHSVSTLRFWIWDLEESSGRLECVLKHGEGGGRYSGVRAVILTADGRKLGQSSLYLYLLDRPNNSDRQHLGSAASVPACVLSERCACAEPFSPPSKEALVLAPFLEVGSGGPER